MAGLTSILAAARSISHGRAGPVSTDVAAESLDSEEGGHEPGGSPGSGSQNRFRVHIGMFLQLQG